VVHVRKKSGSALKIMNFGISSTPSNCIRNGVISNMEGIAANLKKVVTNSGISEKNVKIVISAGSNIVSKVLHVKKDERKSIEELLKDAVHTQIPKNIHSYKLFYRVTGEVEISGMNCYKVLVTIVPDTVIDAYVKLVRYLDFKPLAVEIPFSSVARFFCSGVRIINNKRENTNLVDIDGGSVAVIDLGSETTNISVLRNGALEFNRIILIGGKNLDERISNRLEVSRETAERYKKMFKADSGSAANDDNEIAVEDCIKEHLNEILRSVKMSLDFYASRCYGDMPSKIVFIGGGSGLSGLKQLTEKIIGMPAFTLDMMQFGNIEFSNSLDKDKLRYLINAIGTAM
jgi:type IV pilus assembly protein PilM